MQGRDKGEALKAGVWGVGGTSVSSQQWPFPLRAVGRGRHGHLATDLPKFSFITTRDFTIRPALDRLFHVLLLTVVLTHLVN
jgi:hypothetical protein